MSNLKFLRHQKSSSDPILINPELLELKMIPLAPGLPSSLMYCLTKKNPWLVNDLRHELNYDDDGMSRTKTSIIVDEEEFNKQLMEFINDRPDLVVLIANDPTG